MAELIFEPMSVWLQTFCPNQAMLLAQEQLLYLEEATYIYHSFIRTLGFYF